MWKVLLAGLLLITSNSLSAQPVSIEQLQPDNPFPEVRLETSMGTIVIEMDRNRSPITVNNFLSYVVKGHYDNTIFHRIIPGFVVQGGGYGVDLNEKPLDPAIVNESGNGLSNEIMTVAMARMDDPHSANSQFFFNLADNYKLDPKASRWGYTVFGEVTEGQEVIEAMAKVPTGHNGQVGWDNFPLTTIMLNKAVLVEY
ncbi:peptidylprolyl isomerase [Paraferrimonas haliotis]|uniref:Peptidyl-prolyl cis-trans isomerase n=1 Tax=Paraferrimonas haliotis TaxID=2013866 RepID=A0AA37WWU5_9GAMM|nr:peptidylprolyl isomerase [Paraferrimonas haliotis]GLS82774.1 peptidyl-prolyl cis-trans isomerase [Paraferrimonas haliotis]